MPTSRASFIEYRGTALVYLDFSGVQIQADAMERIAAARAFIARQPKNSLFTLTNVDGSYYNREIVQAMGALVEHNKPYVVAGALVGVSGMMRIFLNTLNRVTGRRLTTFEKEADAKEWLFQQAQTARGA